MRSLLREAVDWLANAPPRRRRPERGRQLSTSRGGGALCDPVTSDEEVGRISRNLVKRMPHLFEFVRDAEIPWHNNSGEGAIRPICVERKMSGGMRSAVGARTYARLKSVHEAKGRGVSAGRDGSPHPSPDPSPHETRLHVLSVKTFTLEGTVLGCGSGRELSPLIAPRSPPSAEGVATAVLDG